MNIKEEEGTSLLFAQRWQCLSGHELVWENEEKVEDAMQSLKDSEPKSTE